jgi:hypothetical protein
MNDLRKPSQQETMRRYEIRKYPTDPELVSHGTPPYTKSVDIVGVKSTVDEAVAVMLSEKLSYSGYHLELWEVETTATRLQ